MKKIVAIALTLMMLCGAVTVFADSDLTTPSKTTGDLTSFEATVQNPVAGKTVALEVATDEATQQTAEEELEKAQAAGSVEKYFGKETAEAIAEILGDNAEVSLDEFMPIVLNDYEEGMGDVVLSVKLATPYQEGEKVAVLIGIIENNVVATWKAFEGIGQADGQVQFTMDAETAKAVAAGNAVFASCSK